MSLDLVKKEKLIAKLESLDEGLYACLSVEEFLDGNDDAGSLAVNADLNFALARDVLMRAARMPSVSAVSVLIVDPMDGEDDSWVYSDLVLLATSASVEEVEGWFERLAPDEVNEWSEAAPAGAPKPRKGERLVSVWWD